MDFISKTQSDFMSFNKALVTIAAAICVGIATKEAISNIMHDIILPFLGFIIHKSFTYILYNKAMHLVKNKYLTAIIASMGRLVWILLVWLIILYITYIVFKKIIVIDFVGDKVNTFNKLKNYFS